MRAISLPASPASGAPAWLFAAALAAFALAGPAFSDGAAQPAFGGQLGYKAAPAPEAPSCVGCHSGEAPAPDDVLHGAALTGDERATLAARLAPRRE